MSLQREKWKAWKERHAEWFEPLVLLLAGVLCIGIALLMLAFWIPLLLIQQPWRKKNLQP